MDGVNEIGVMEGIPGAAPGDVRRPAARPSIVKDLARVNLSLLNTTSHYSVLNNQSSDHINTINTNIEATRRRNPPRLLRPPGGGGGGGE